jgi:hypothetical protein
MTKGPRYLAVEGHILETGLIDSAPVKRCRLNQEDVKKPADELDKEQFLSPTHTVKLG